MSNNDAAPELDKVKTVSAPSRHSHGYCAARMTVWRKAVRPLAFVDDVIVRSGTGSARSNRPLPSAAKVGVPTPSAPKQ